MEIYREHLRNIAASLQEALQRKEYHTLSDLERIAHQVIHPKRKRENLVVIGLHPDILNTKILIVSCLHPYAGATIEIRCNQMTEYMCVLLKMQEILAGYTPVSKDPYGNVHQRKPLHPLDWKMVEQELTYLSNLST